MTDIFRHHLPAPRPGCIFGCVADHSDEPDGLRTCRTVAAIVEANTLPPFPDPCPIVVGAARSIGDTVDADMDEPLAVTLSLGDTAPDRLTPAAARALGWALLGEADRVEGWLS